MIGIAPARTAGLSGWTTRLIASRKFQKWSARFPFTRGIVRREGEALFDLLAGFCHSQILMALVRLKIPQKLMDQPAPLSTLAALCDIPEPRMEVLLRAGIALKLLKCNRRGTYSLTRTGAALLGVPGLLQMIDHHDVLYRDLADPVAFFRGDVETELAAFWPYVFGGTMPSEAANTYSDLMAQSQVLVAEDTLRCLDFSKSKHLLDVGGGSGAFLEAVGHAYPDLHLTVFDLPQVAPSAQDRFANAGLSDRATIATGSFRDDSLPEGCDTISLIRVLYDHSDETVAALIAKCFAALPIGGRLMISEPMLGQKQPERAGDAYFALYTMAMRTGKTRSAGEIAKLCADLGFKELKIHPSPRPFITSCIEARKVEEIQNV